MRISLWVLLLLSIIFHKFCPIHVKTRKPHFIVQLVLHVNSSRQLRISLNKTAKIFTLSKHKTKTCEWFRVISWIVLYRICPVLSLFGNVQHQLHTVGTKWSILQRDSLTYSYSHIFLAFIYCTSSFNIPLYYTRGI